MPQVFRLRTLISRHFKISNEAADLMIGEGRVRVEGKAVSPAAKVESWEEISVDGKIIREKTVFTYIKFYKPRGIECTLNAEIENNLLTVFTIPQKLFPVGRLDKESEGLLIMTDDGRIFNQVAISEREKEKEYLVKVDKEFDDDFLLAMSGGVEIIGKKTRPCKLTRINEKTFAIILTQGLNRQIRRMCYKLGFEVEELKRVRIVNVLLSDLKVGEWRELSSIEVQGLL